MLVLTVEPQKKKNRKKMVEVAIYFLRSSSNIHGQNPLKDSGNALEN